MPERTGRRGAARPGFPRTGAARGCARRGAGGGSPWAWLACAVLAWLVDPAGAVRSAGRLEPTLLACAAAASAPAGAPSAPAHHTDPFEAYRAGDWEEALRLFLDAKAERPHDPRVDFDLGNTLYRKGDFAGAAQAYARADAASRDPKLQAGARYNRGNALFREQELEEAAKAYEKALELAPKDEDARRNLDVVRRAMQQKQQQKQQQGSEDEKKPEDSKQQQQQQQQQQGQPQPSDQEQQQREQQARSQPQQSSGGAKAPEDQQAQSADANRQPGEKDAGQASAGGEKGNDEKQAPAAGQPGQAKREGGLSRQEAERYLRQLGDTGPRIPKNQRGGRSSRPEKDW